MEVDARVVDYVEQNGDLSNEEEADTNNNPSGEGDGVNGDPISAIEGRITRKAKRRLRKSPSKETPPAPEPVNGMVTVSQREKNLRKSRTGRGRGLPKKGGAGGKGTWGPPGLYEENDANCQDVNDPNYDSDVQANITLKAITPKLKGEELQEMVEPILREYYEHGDTDEVAACLSQLNIDDTDRHELASVAVTLALEKKDPEKEMTSVLLSDLYGLKVMSELELEVAFKQLLHALPDISLDSPDAPALLGKFIARAIADDCLAPRFLQRFQEDISDDHMSHQAVDGANTLLSMKHGIMKLDNVWGVGGGRRPVKVLIKKMVMLIKEYLSSSDIKEAIRCLQELEVPHFHHEVVYEAVFMVLEQYETIERVAPLMAQLLKAMFDSNVITIDQRNTGFQRIFTNLPDIVIDVPHAYAILEKFAEICLQKGFISAQLKAEVPQRVRKRFVSEGDGGRLKE